MTLLARKDGNQIIEEVLPNGMVGSRDIVNVGCRKNQLGVFRRLLNDPSFFQRYKSDEHVAQAGMEAVWQQFFERNTWIFGYGLNYVWCNNLPDLQLEQVVKGADFNSAGKRTDALLRTAAQVSQFVLVEIKTPQAPLLAGTAPRPGVWAPSSDVAAGVAQIQKTVTAFKRQYFDKAELVDEQGDPLGDVVYNYAPKSYLLIGTLSQFDTGRGLNKEKYSSFQLLRRSLTDPEILTLDELYERAAAIVGHSERSL